ncbi:MAG: CbiQ family ECF transporter T component [Actinomycetota bacterium]
MSHARLPRAVHPLAWWLWALGLATAASRTTNPLLLLLILAVVGLVVSARRPDAPWARALKYYLGMALVVIAIRVLFRSVFGNAVDRSDHVLFTLPQVPLPSWLAGVQLGGSVTLEGTLAAAYDGLRLGVLLCCIGGANALANPRRTLRLLPPALYELGVAVVVSISVAPQLVESVQRVRRARRLRGGTGKKLHAVRSIALPVLQDALDRSLRLAAAMDSRGYGRRSDASRGDRRMTGGLLIGGLAGLCVGLYGLLDATVPRPLGLPALLVGGALCCAGLALGGRRVHRSSYRPDPWRGAEWVVAGAGLVAAIVVLGAPGVDGAAFNPSLHPLAYPALPLLPVLAILLAAIPAVAAPPPMRSAAVAVPT